MSRSFHIVSFASEYRKQSAEQAVKFSNRHFDPATRSNTTKSQNSRTHSTVITSCMFKFKTWKKKKKSTKGFDTQRCCNQNLYLRTEKQFFCCLEIGSGIASVTTGIAVLDTPDELMWVTVHLCRADDEPVFKYFTKTDSFTYHRSSR